MNLSPHSSLMAATASAIASSSGRSAHDHLLLKSDRAWVVDGCDPEPDRHRHSARTASIDYGCACELARVLTGYLQHWPGHTPACRGASIGIYNAEQSSIDAFRLRHREGPELAYEALRRWLRRRDSSPAEIMRMARHLPKAEPALRRALEVLL